MGRRKGSWNLKKISTSSIANAIKELKITHIKKSCKAETFGLICSKIGRKNPKANRLAVEYLFKRRCIGKMYKRSPKIKYSSTEYTTLYQPRKSRLKLALSSEKKKFKWKLLKNRFKDNNIVKGQGVNETFKKRKIDFTKYTKEESGTYRGCI